MHFTIFYIGNKNLMLAYCVWVGKVHNGLMMLRFCPIELDFILH